MDLFLVKATQASSISELPFSELEASWNRSVDIEEAKEHLFRLIDAYSIGDQAAYRDIYEQAIMRAITSFLSYALRQVQVERKSRHTVKWQLNLADILLLTMFFSDLLTINDSVLYHSLMQALALLYSLALPLVFLPSLNATSARKAEEEEEKELCQSTRSELNALRVMLSKRLVVSAATDSEGCTPYSAKMILCQWILDALMQFFHTLWNGFQRLQEHKDTIPNEKYAHDADVMIHELTELCDGLLIPVKTSLESQIQCLNAPTTNSGSRAPPFRENGIGSGNTRAALLVTSALHALEYVVWKSRGGEDLVKDPMTDLSPNHPSTRGGHSADPVFQHIANELIGLLHKYLTLRQHLSAEGAASGTMNNTLNSLSEREGGRYFSRQGDVFRSASVQHAMRRVLSAAVEPININNIDNERQLLQPQERAVLTAALNSFGGAVKPQAMREDNEPNTNKTAEAFSDEWARGNLGGSESPLRRCTAVLAVKSGGKDGPHYDGDGLEALAAEEEGLDLGARRPLVLQSSLGPVTASALVDMVMLSLSALNLLTEDAIYALHLQGLQIMQYEASKRAQAEELERLRRLEQQGVDAIPWGKLLEHVHNSAFLHAKGLKTLRQTTARAKLLREAFSSILNSYRFMKKESETTVRNAQALIARTLVQIPAAMSDAALDELLLHLLREFRQEQKIKQELSHHQQHQSSGGGGGNPTGTSGVQSLVSQPGAYYQLTLQVLFMSFAAQAPVRTRGASDVATAALLLEDDGLLIQGDSGAASSTAAGAILRSKKTPTIDTENPIAFLYDGGLETPGAIFGQKRPRGNEGNEMNIDDQTSMNAFGKEDEGDGFCFLNDTRSVPYAYSHILCRVMELAESCQLNAILLDILLQAPSLTLYAWNYLYRQYCLSSDKVRCIIGFWLLKNIAIRREVYRSCALNLLLHLCSSTREYARRLAIREIGSLLTSAQGLSGKPVISQEVEALLIRHAKRQMASIPGFQHLSPTRGVENDDEEGGEAGKSVEETRAQEVLGRYLGLFLKLCLRQPRQLFPSLLEMYKQCVERNQKVMMRMIPRHVDIHRMVQLLLKSDPASFMITVVPYLRRYSKEAISFVQSILSSIGENLREMATEASAVGMANGMETLENYKKVAIALLAHFKAMYVASVIPVSSNDPTDGVKEGESEGGLHDIRFMAPFLSLVFATELKETYLRAFLYFIQVQLQLQRRFELHGGRDGLSTKESNFLLTRAELREFIKAVIREVLVKHPLRFDDGAARGMSLVDFFIYLHRAPQESSGKQDTFVSGGAQGLFPRNQENGILDTSAPQQQDLAFDNKGENVMPPIGVITTREVLAVCLELTRTFDSSTTIPLYGPEDVLKAIKRMMHAPPVPSQLMSTILMAEASFPRVRGVDLVRAIVQEVLLPLERASAWQSDPQLWRGVLLFAEKYYRECGNFLMNLPDQVLIQALRDHPVLMAHVREEHGNNASFGHILANV
ncbi:unnamed protein product [Phytomonas sp. Hart1]|nr:unnamed protein product [Phytomonas sp. Hart1]|eukprot:CCW69619.1 unnamed protein product [Phytomonas sp. isolate Hart1]